MKILMSLSVGLLAAGLLWSGAAFGQSEQGKPGCDKAGTPQNVDGQVVRIDTTNGKVTVRDNNGTTHEFQASKETLQDLKVGDRIEAKLRSAPNC